MKGREVKIVFFGTGKFGLPTLKKLLNSKHDVVAVVTQPDSKKGRTMDVVPAPVKAFAEKAVPGVEILQPSDIKDSAIVDHLRSKAPDVFVVVDYGQLLSEEILKIPGNYSINLHPSLLPKYRGAAPVNRAILNGEKETGNTVIKMTGCMDAGEIIVQEKTPIKDEEAAPELLERLAKEGARLVMKALDMIGAGELELTEQDEAEATQAPKLQKKDGKIEWKDPASYIIRKVRAMQPWPGAFTYLDGKTLKIFKAHAVSDAEKAASPGTVVDEKNFIVKAGEEAVQVDVLQLEGKRKMTRDEFLRGYKLAKGIILSIV